MIDTSIPPAVSNTSANFGASRSAGAFDVHDEHDWNRYDIVGLLVVAGLAAAQLLWTWGKWADVVIDFGRELYIPWQLTQGKTLYSDIAYFNGPLSPYVNSLWFRLFGVSLWTLVICNIALFGVLLVLLYRILVGNSGRVAAAAGCIACVSMFGLAHLVWVANFNYVCPYSHELTHGLLLSLIAMSSAVVYRRRPRTIVLAVSGLAIGLIFLTKIEVFVAAAVAVTIAVAIPIENDRRPLRRWCIYLGCVAAPVVFSIFLLCLRLPFADAVRGTLGSWVWAFQPQARSLVYFQAGMGTLDWRDSISRMAIWAAGYAAVFGALVFVDRRTTLRSTARVWLGVGGILFGVYVSEYTRHPIEWSDVARPLPLLVAAACLVQVVGILRSRGNRRLSELHVARLVFGVFAFVLLAKMLFNTRVRDYGFVLAMPAAMLTIAVLMDWIPAALRRRGGAGIAFQMGAGLLLVVCIAQHLARSQLVYRGQTFPVSSGSDALLADNRGPMVQTILDDLSARCAADQTIAVFPEGVMINYLLRRTNPTPYLYFMPFDLIVFGEDRMRRAFENHPPDFVVMVHKDTTEYGFARFGRDYGRSLFEWIERNYVEVRRVGARPFNDDDQFGVALLERKHVH